MPRHPLCLIMLAGMLPLAAAAHDFWIEAHPFQLGVGESADLVLLIGEDFSGDSQPYNPEAIVDFSVRHAGQRRSVQNTPGADPAGLLSPREDGLYLVGYHSSQSYVDLPADRFHAYLEQEGLEHVIRLRAERGESESNGREYYSRSARSLLAAGDAARAAGYDHPLGYPVELIAQANPYALRAGDQLPVEFRYLDEPVAGILVVAFTADSPERKFSARTGTDGRIMLPLDRAGTWLVKAVHITELADSPDAEWESFWATLTFALQ